MGHRLENLKHDLIDDARKLWGPVRWCPYCRQSHAVKDAEITADNKIVATYECRYGKVKLTYEFTERWKAVFF